MSLTIRDSLPPKANVLSWELHGLSFRILEIQDCTSESLQTFFPVGTEKQPWWMNLGVQHHLCHLPHLPLHNTWSVSLKNVKLRMGHRHEGQLTRVDFWNLESIILLTQPRWAGFSKADHTPLMVSSTLVYNSSPQAPFHTLLKIYVSSQPTPDLLL